MRALVVDRTAPGGLVLGEAPEPECSPHEALVAVSAFSLNRGEVVRKDAVAGTVPGWDAAGTVLTPAADGSGPPAGTRVLTWGRMGGFAERRAMNVDNLAVIPEAVSMTDAAALPVAGLTALGALRAAGPILGSRVLITGASGGVGRFATQFAHRGGAEVTAVVGSAERALGLTELGADRIAIGIDEAEGPFEVALDTVGGPTLIGCWTRLARGGIVVSIGRAAREDAVFQAWDTPMRDNLRLLCYTLEGPVGEGLAQLLGLVASGGIDPQVDWTGSWQKVATAVELFLARSIRGKVVLQVD